jgi:hypothetical protein
MTKSAFVDWTTKAASLLLAQKRQFVDSERTTAILKVFRRGPRRDICHRVVAFHVDKPRKDEAAVSLVLAMGKERSRWRLLAESASA